MTPPDSDEQRSKLRVGAGLAPAHTETTAFRFLEEGRFKAGLVLIAVFFMLLSTGPAFAQAPTNSGTVELPRTTYDALVDAGRDPKTAPRPAPVPWALGSAQVTATVSAADTATVTVDLRLRVLEDGWNLVPILPAGTPVDEASVDGSPIQLAATADGLAWGVREAGSYSMRLVYRTDVQNGGDGSTLALPVPQASAIVLRASVPETGINVSVVPSAGREIRRQGNQTTVRATVPSTRAVTLSWRRPTERGHVLSRAAYRGRLEDDAVRFTADYELTLLGEDSITLPLLPQSVTLSRLEVNGEPAPIMIENGRFGALVRGRGDHRVTVGFEVSVREAEGPPSIRFELPAVPVSSLELQLPGKKDVVVEPASSVRARFTGGQANEQASGQTVATVNLPMTTALTVAWTEAVPEDVRAELRAHAGLYHAAWAEEGVLYLRALVDVQVTRGATSSWQLSVPADVQVNDVRSPNAGVVDWRLEEAASGSARRLLTVFLDREIDDQLRLDVRYDRSLPSSAAEPEIQPEAAAESTGAEPAKSAGPPQKLPLLESPEAQRQRGMVALLASRELTLEPIAQTTAAGAVTRIGENQLPAFVRDALEHTVAHTFKYVETPDLNVAARRPEREQGRFDALVDTLISLGEVTLEAAASVELDVKSGSLTTLELELPAGAHLLALSGPSVREHSTEPVSSGGQEEDDTSESGPVRQRIQVEFTQEMEGQFRLDLSYEHILVDGADVVPVPTLTVKGAEVEQGRLAVEALSAVEVQPEEVKQLTPLDIAELPRRLILRTTNPILHAYKYVGADRQLDLRVTRHRVFDVQEAAIDEARYKTLMTRDGLAVTHARFAVRNSREQFLRVRLPRDSKVWTVFVDGQPEKPARAEQDGEVWHLIRIIHSTQGFPVELVYETPAAPIRGLGTVEGTLPRPHILVTQSRWDVWVPSDVDYRSPTGRLDWIETPVVDGDSMAAALDELGDAMEPLRIEVPTSGRRFSFEKLYANQGEGDIGFAIPYVTGIGRSLGRLGVFSGAALVWFGLAALWIGRRRTSAVLIASGLLLLVLLLGRYAIGAGPAIWTSVLAILLTASLLVWRWRARSFSWEAE